MPGKEVGESEYLAVMSSVMKVKGFCLLLKFDSSDSSNMERREANVRFSRALSAM